MDDQSTDTMTLWDSVSKTDPKYAKQVNQRGGFTSVCAQSRVMRATEVFGPMGIGWGVRGESFTVLDLGKAHVLLYQAEMFYKAGDDTGTIQLHSAAKLSDGRVDDDAPKKAATDALTKGLSKLGFSADVFLGLFDDNKYVENLRDEFAGKKKKAGGGYKATIDAALSQYGADSVRRVHLGLGVDGKAPRKLQPLIMAAWRLIGGRDLPTEDQMDQFKTVVLDSMAPNGGNE